MANPIIKVVNVETGEEIERPMNDQEFKAYKAEQELSKAQLAEAEAKEAARQSALEKLAALGLTQDEIKAIAG